MNTNSLTDASAAVNLPPIHTTSYGLWRMRHALEVVNDRRFSEEARATLLDELGDEINRDVRFLSAMRMTELRTGGAA